MTRTLSEMEGLIALCDKTSNDIRSCLNTLQFLSKREDKITSKMINELSIGQKDHEKGLFTIMNEIFYKKTSKK
jgi:chromosome transmission fidelity protein 18